MTYRVVPIEPTEAQSTEGCDSLHDKGFNFSNRADADACYRAMVAAAPEFVVTDDFLLRMARDYYEKWRQGRGMHEGWEDADHDYWLYKAKDWAESFIRSLGGTT